ncbi:MAG: GNAT family N-acetyltransferase [Jatrophihabitantaceae bacterium]
MPEPPVPEPPVPEPSAGRLGGPPKRASYRTAALLAGLLLLGWAADLVTGAGHSLGWLLALLLVGGIPALGAWSARHRPSEVAQAVAPPDDQQPTPSGSRVIRPARPDELVELIEIERAADQLFPLAGYGTVPPPATVAELRAAAALLVSGEPPTGYARIEVVDGRAHLAGLSVRPRFMRQGRGSELVLAACDWAAAHGYSEMTLCTFAEVPWNGPFYARLGFIELAELTPGLRAARETEQALDAMGRRVVLIRSTRL